MLGEWVGEYNFCYNVLHVYGVMRGSVSFCHVTKYKILRNGVNELNISGRCITNTSYVGMPQKYR